MRDTSSSPSPNLKTVARPPQPSPLPAWKLVDDPTPYRYTWLGRTRTVERLAATADPKARQYSYVHLLGTAGKVLDGKLDHWVPTSLLQPVSDAEEKPRCVKTLVRRVDHIIFGEVSIPAWYSSAFPTQLHEDLLENGGRLYVCPVCLKYTTRKSSYLRHHAPDGTCGGNGRFKGLSHPPGYEIFRRDDWSIWEVDGGEESDEEERDQPTFKWDAMAQEGPMSLQLLEMQYRERYCHSLCLIARLFLDTKLNRYGSGPFRFFVLTQHSRGRHMFRGMFSREKGHSNNLSCIVTLPPWQKCGWGKRLIHISYLLSRIEGVSGQPEKPLSALGQRVYERYHNEQVLRYLKHRLKHRSGRAETRSTVAEIVTATGIERDDVAAALRRQQLVMAPGRLDDIDWNVVASKQLNSIDDLLHDQPGLYHLSHEELQREHSAPPLTF